MSTKESLRRTAGTVEESAVRVDTDTTEQMIEALNRDLAATTSEILRDTLEDREDDAHEIEHFLEDDTLVLEEATR